MCSLSIPSSSSPFRALPFYYGTGVTIAESHERRIPLPARPIFEQMCRLEIEKDREARLPDPFFIPMPEARDPKPAACGRYSQSPMTSRFFFFISAFFCWKDCFAAFSFEAADWTAGSDVPGCAC